MEMADYERLVKELNSKLSEKDECAEALRAQINTLVQKEETLKQEIGMTLNTSTLFLCWINFRFHDKIIRATVTVVIVHCMTRFSQYTAQQVLGLNSLMLNIHSFYKDLMICCLLRLMSFPFALTPEVILLCTVKMHNEGKTH